MRRKGCYKNKLLQQFEAVCFGRPLFVYEVCVKGNTRTVYTIRVSDGRSVGEKRKEKGV